ncbi:hypothetical protein Pmar_PMAR022516 [Perkinsus marinus ATCC 50983]|uniref:Uncharacterized protein n=1 Tax=Perkinsus marinus (strain ATCC 50983 / TXsc) TaxID=423536 RepID=C5KNG9_PERM5|nr:hypothetical protein Pmar_PMAR022516 [Perkinsus marinus ATCC 50983]EER13984.1 hypothetical protein Pmar_PMAR022516 [Perkinsus marinus ATCC 50983]|eukprot:XP_002782189.1 hypothetical protein Pmar_PMAR022516 [Perkinsus marinus ATCC 50983]
MRPTDDDSKEKSLPRKASMKVAEDLQSKLSRVRHKAESEGQVWTNSPRNRYADSTFYDKMLDQRADAPRGPNRFVVYYVMVIFS